MRGQQLLLLSWLAAASITITASIQSLPTVDLGYEIHQAISFNSTGQTYNFSNIRYAQPPLGHLRFAAPVPPVGRNPHVQNGSVGKICPQGYVGWGPVAFDFVEAYVSGRPFNFSATSAAIQPGNPVTEANDGRTTEDCLFLDVIVPRTIIDAAQKSETKQGQSEGAAVLVWIYGGGYTVGDKTVSGNPAGLIRASQANNNTGIIYVALNYRLGAFGFLAGPTLQANGTANAGLYDQRLALHWVQKHISAFGGDPDRITVMGESAGGGSIIHQITAFGGSLPVPFQQVIPQSGAFVPRISNEQQEATFQQFLSMLNISTLQEARSLPSSALVAVNAQQILVAPYGTWPYGPVVDGVFTPDLPGNLLSRGLFARNVKMMIGYNANEGLLFVDPRVTNDTGFRNLLRGDLPLIQDSVLDYILNDLYPPIYDGSQAYTSLTTRIALVIAEAFFTCNSNYFDRAYSNNTFAYQFSIEPAIHGQDIPYTFYNGPSPDVANVTVAQALQDYIVSFAQKGVPTSRLQHAAPFPLYGDDRPTKQDLNLSSISTVVVNKSVNARCLWWQKALYF